MRSTPDPPDHGAPDRGPDGSPLPAIDHAASRWQAETERLLRLTIEALQWGGTGHVAGCTVNDYLTIECGLPRWLASQLESVAQRVNAVPQVAGLFWDGVLSFDQLAGFVRAAASYNGELLARLDGEAASLAEQLVVEQRLHAWSHEVAFLVEDLKAPGWRDRQERRLERGERVTIQQDFDGGGFLGAHLGPVALPTVANALRAEVDAEEADRVGVQRARATALVRIAELRLAGTVGCSDHDGCGEDCDGSVPARAPRATVVWHVDILHATTDRFAQLLRVVGADGGQLIPISKRLLATLADNADHVIQLRQGHRPLDELAVQSDDIPARTRRVVLRRDRGCRFPNCGRPAVHAHHIVPRAQGGSHSPDNLIAACALHHLRYVHRLGWKLLLDPESGVVTWTNTRTGTQVATRPNGHRPAPARDPSLLPDWLAPPRPPPPVDADPPPTADQLLPA